MQSHHKELKEYRTKVYQAYSRSKLRGETLGCDVITLFRSETIRTWVKTTLIERSDIMALRGVHLSPDRSTSSPEKLIELLYPDEPIPANPHTSYQESIAKNVVSNAPQEAADSTGAETRRSSTGRTAEMWGMIP